MIISQPMAFAHGGKSCWSDHRVSILDCNGTSPPWLPLSTLHCLLPCLAGFKTVSFGFVSLDVGGQAGETKREQCNVGEASLNATVSVPMLKYLLRWWFLSQYPIQDSNSVRSDRSLTTFPSTREIGRPASCTLRTLHSTSTRQKPGKHHGLLPVLNPSRPRRLSLRFRRQHLFSPLRSCSLPFPAQSLPRRRAGSSDTAPYPCESGEVRYGSSCVRRWVQPKHCSRLPDDRRQRSPRP